MSACRRNQKPHRRADSGNTPPPPARVMPQRRRTYCTGPSFLYTGSRIEASEINLLDPHVVAGLSVACRLSSCHDLKSSGRSSFSIVNEVRRQFREMPGIMDNTQKPDYARCVDICTRDSIKEMILPGVITILSPVVIGFILGPVALGAFLIGAIITGLILAISFANSGGSWDNAKKWVETGAYGGKGSDAHKAAVVGDM